MKIQLIIIGIVYLFFGCGNEHYTIEIINNRESNLLFDYGKYDITDPRQVRYVEYYVWRLKKNQVEKKQQIYLPHSTIHSKTFEEYIENSPNKYLEFYVFNLDSLLKYRKDYKITYLIENKLYDQKFNLTEDTLDKLDWTITLD